MRPECRRRVSYQGEHRVDIACLFDVEYVVRSLQHGEKPNVAVTSNYAHERAADSATDHDRHRYIRYRYGCLS